MKPLIDVLLILLQLYSWILVAMIVYSWASAFGVLDRRNAMVLRIGDLLYSLTEPVLRPIRRVVPAINGFDISPIIAFLIIYLLQRYLAEYIRPIVP